MQNKERELEDGRAAHVLFRHSGRIVPEDFHRKRQYLHQRKQRNVAEQRIASERTWFDDAIAFFTMRNFILEDDF